MNKLFTVHLLLVAKEHWKIEYSSRTRYMILAVKIQLSVSIVHWYIHCWSAAQMNKPQNYSHPLALSILWSGENDVSASPLHA